MKKLIGAENKSRITGVRFAPQHVILNTNLCLGWDSRETQEWIKLAEDRGIGWWDDFAFTSPDRVT